MPAKRTISNAIPVLFFALASASLSGATTMVSTDPSGAPGGYYSYEPSLSADGRRVAFHSWAENLVAGDTNNDHDAFVYDRLTQVMKRVSVDSAGQQADGHSYHADVSDDGRFVAYMSEAVNLVPGDTNGHGDIFVHALVPIAAVAARSAGANPTSYSANAAVLGLDWLPSVDLTTTGHSFALMRRASRPLRGRRSRPDPGRA